MQQVLQALLKGVGVSRGDVGFRTFHFVLFCNRLLAAGTYAIGGITDDGIKHLLQPQVIESQ